jgi:hypothetical protein
MKKTFIITTLLLCAVGVYAQDYQKSVGARIGSGIGLSYKQFVTSKNAFEANLDLTSIFGHRDVTLNATGFYLWQWSLGNVKNLNWYVGPGASLGLTFGDDTVLNLAIDGIIGIEYKFDNIPLALGVDLSPRWYFFDGGYFSWPLALTARYTF